MARRRHTPEQVVRKLREADRLLAEGEDVAGVARHLEVSEQTYHRGQNQFGGMKADDVKRLKELERENAMLKRIVADKELLSRSCIGYPTATKRTGARDLSPPSRRRTSGAPESRTPHGAAGDLFVNLGPAKIFRRKVSAFRIRAGDVRLAGDGTVPPG